MHSCNTAANDDSKGKGVDASIRPGGPAFQATALCTIL